MDINIFMFESMQHANIYNIFILKIFYSHQEMLFL